MRIPLFLTYLEVQSTSHGVNIVLHCSIMVHCASLALGVLSVSVQLPFIVLYSSPYCKHVLHKVPLVRLKSNIAQRPQDPVCTLEITLHANKYKPRTTGHSSQLISELFHQPNDVRRLQRIWPESHQWMVPDSRHSSYILFTNYSIKT
jgi:hypothetical protein